MSKGTLTVRVLGDTKPLEKSLGKIGGIAKTGFAAVGVAAAAAIGGSIKVFADFDSAMTGSLAIMGDVSDTMRSDMSKAAREIGKTTKFSATQAAESYFYLASAGLDANQSIAALPQVARFAQAGMFDMALATDLATDAQSALGLASDDAEQNLRNLTRVTDVFVKANTLANTSVEQISEAMTNKAGAAMRSVGMDIEEGAAVLAAFADQGTKGAEAGTQFSIVLRDLQTRALENKEAFEKADVAVFDAKGEFRNMADIVGDLEGALDGQTDAQRKTTLATLGFTDKSIASLQALLGTSEAIRGYESDLRDAGGTTQEIADNQMESFQAKWGILKDKIIDVGITVGEALMPTIERAMGWLETNALPVIERVTAAFTEDGLGGAWDVLIAEWDRAWPQVHAWMSEVATPALIDWAINVGKAMGEALWQGFLNQMKSIPQEALQGAGLGGFISDIGKFLQPGSPGSPGSSILREYLRGPGPATSVANTPPRSITGGGFQPEFHEGGEVVSARVLVGERVMSRKQNRMFKDLHDAIVAGRGGQPPQVTVNVDRLVGDPHEVGRAAAFALRMA